MKTIAAPRFHNHTTPCTAKPHLFHPTDGRTDTQTAADRTAAAIDACLNCPHMLPCRDWARTHGEYGIWGAETDDERTRAGYPPKILSVDTKPDCGTEAGAKWHRRHGKGTPCRRCLEAERAARQRREQAAAANGGPRLAPRELEILHATIQGVDTAVIAARCGITRKSVNSYIARIRKVLGVTSNAQLATATHTAGVLDHEGAAA